MDKKVITEARLEEALERLLSGSPIRVKPEGTLTLNKVNKEAGLSHSYVHKFKEFVERATPKIDDYNSAKKQAIEGVSFGEVELTEIEKLKADLKREKSLKERYRLERDDAKAAQKELEALNSTLMFRLYELQEELGRKSLVSISKQI
jgi:hypothetical protein